MPYINILLHFVWSTKYRHPILQKNARDLLFPHIKTYSTSKGIHLDCINGHDDHVHCVVLLSATQTAGKVIQLIKGESSWWANGNKITAQKLEWQDEYYVTSDCPSELPRVRRYIANQEEHHRTKTFNEEYQEMIAAWAKREKPFNE